MLQTITTQTFAERVFAKLLRWIIFTVFFSLLPFIGTWLGDKLQCYPKNYELKDFALGGQFFLLAASISADTLGELFGSSSNSHLWKIMIGGIQFLVFALALLLYSQCFGKDLDEVDEISLKSMSLISLFSSVFIGLWCLYFTEER
jgi:hypothetical protein